jgi:fructose-bisphosphate aldolase class I
MMVANDKGLLAMDESNPTCNKRFAKWGIPQNEETRRAYREMIVTTPGLGESIRGAAAISASQTQGNSAKTAA